MIQQLLLLVVSLGALGSTASARIAQSSSERETYNPLALPAGLEIERFDLVARRDKRALRMWVFLPKPAVGEPRAALPVILFSHGLGGDRKGGVFFGEHWAARGYAVAFIQHPGSDDSIWRGVKPDQRLTAFREAASHANLTKRCADVRAVIDALENWNRTSGHALQGRIDTGRIGMSGHSFGAVTTQMVSGQRSGLSGAKKSEHRIDASIAFSPSPPRTGSAKKAFAEVFVPMMLMTGTNDTAFIGKNDVKSRKRVYQTLPKSNDRYEVVLAGAEHSVFTETRLFGEESEPNPDHRRVILALSTAFWDAYLMHDAAAREWLAGGGPRGVMEESDTWRMAHAK